MTIEELRRLLNNAADEAFLPSGWQRLVSALPALVEIADAAMDLMDAYDRFDNVPLPDDTAVRAALDRLDAVSGVSVVLPDQPER